MTKVFEFSKRNLKELIRDPLSLVFSFGLPIFLLIIFNQFKIPSEVYELKNFAPGMIVFSYAFLSLFTATLISKDRSSSFLTRLYASPLTPIQFVLGYIFALIPISILQSILFFMVSILLGLTFSINIILTIFILIPVSILFISLGILIGCLVGDKAAPGVSSIVIQLVAFTSGLWFDINTVGGVIKVLSIVLPFSHSLDLTRYSLAGQYDKIFISLLIVIIYIIISFKVAFLVFKKKMQSDNK